MAENNENQKKLNTCWEDTPCAEMMHKMLGHKGIGSLCTDMMKRMMDHQGEGGSSSCAEMLKAMMQGGSSLKTEGSHDRDK